MKWLKVIVELIRSAELKWFGAHGYGLGALLLAIIIIYGLYLSSQAAPAILSGEYWFLEQRAQETKHIER